jgi:hypothetical protein
MSYRLKLPSDVASKAPAEDDANADVPTYVRLALERIETQRAMVQHFTAKSRLKKKEYYNKFAEAVTYSIGSLVWLRAESVGSGLVRKLAPAWLGPFRVKERLSDVLYRLTIPGATGRDIVQVVNVHRLKPCVVRAGSPLTPPLVTEADLEGDDESLGGLVNLREELILPKLEGESDQQAYERNLGDLEEHLAAFREELEKTGDSDAAMDEELPLLDDEATGRPPSGLDERIQSAQKLVEGRILRKLYDEIETQQSVVLSLPAQASARRSKETLLLLLSEGSPYITSSALKDGFGKRIAACKSVGDLAGFLQDLLGRWNEIFDKEHEAAPPVDNGSRRKRSKGRN